MPATASYVCDSHHVSPDVSVEGLPLAVLGEATMRPQGGGRTASPKVAAQGVRIVFSGEKKTWGRDQMSSPLDSCRKYNGLCPVGLRTPKIDQ